MAKKTINKNVNMAKEEKAKDTILDAEKTENTILDVEKKDSDIIRKALEEYASKEDEQTPTINSEEKVEQVKPIEDNVENEDSQNIKQNGNDKVNTVKHNISKLFGYYWNGQLMD